MKSAVAPPTLTVAPGGAGRSRIRFTVSWLASETNGWAEIAWIAVTSPLSGWGGLTSATPSTLRTRAANSAAPLRPAAFEVDPDRRLAVGREFGC